MYTYAHMYQTHILIRKTCSVYLKTNLKYQLYSIFFCKEPTLHICIKQLWFWPVIWQANTYTQDLSNLEDNSWMSVDNSWPLLICCRVWCSAHVSHIGSGSSHVLQKLDASVCIFLKVQGVQTIFLWSALKYNKHLA